MHNRHAPDFLFHGLKNADSILSLGPIALKVTHEVMVQTPISSGLGPSDLKQTGAGTTPETEKRPYLLEKGDASTFMWCSEEDEATYPLASITAKVVGGICACIY